MPDSKGALYFDTVTLSNFALAGSIPLLVSRYGRRLHLTSAVLDEVLDGLVAGYPALAEIEVALQSGKFRLASPLTGIERQRYRELLRTMAPGEAACIACAKERGGIVVTDDRVARKCCSERNLRFTGTVGILKASCRDGTLSPDRADALLSAMIKAGYHSPVHRISDLLG
jgi:predicted nucleic acid-binding protein